MARFPTPVAALLLALAVVATVGTGPVAGAPTAVQPPFHPSRLTSLGDARQVVIVTSASWSASRGRLRTYELTPTGGWRRVLGPVDATLGRNGFVPTNRRRQGTRTTPAGTFALPWAFGTYADPGTALPYRRVDANDWWPYDPRGPGHVQRLAAPPSRFC